MRKLTPFNTGCIILLWLFLCYIMIKESGWTLTGRGAFAIIVSGIIIFVPIYKRYLKGR